MLSVEIEKPEFFAVNNDFIIINFKLNLNFWKLFLERIFF